jgi:hypothetical protein
MALAADEERALSRIEEELRRSDPKLATKLAMFNRLTRSEAMPERELLTAPGRLRRLSARAGAWTARRRLYPPLSPRGAHVAPPPGPASRSGLGAQPLPGGAQPGYLFSRSPRPSRPPRPGDRRGPAPHRWPARFLAILPVIVTVCALGAVVAIFSALGHVGPPASRPAPASPCRSVLLPGCQSATAHTAHTVPKR